MGKCNLCGEYAGYFRYRHRACVEKREWANNTLVSTGVALLHGEGAGGESDVVKGWKSWRQVADEGFLNDAERKGFAVKVLEEAIERSLEDKLLEEPEQERLMAWMDEAELDRNDPAVDPLRHRLFRAQMLRQLFNGEEPNTIGLDGNLPVLLTKKEKLLYIFQGVNFYEDRTTTRYEGRSSGVSIRVAKGVYYRTGGFKGHPVQETSTTLIDTGMVVLTDMQIYFHGPKKSFRTPYNKIIGLEPYSDGVGLRKDGATAKPQIFQGLDGWFTYNIIKHFAP